MKRIEFIAPVESMRGNLSGNQKLLYAENNNPAFDAPAGRQYARNYQPRFIGAKRSSDNLKYFAVKTKSATLVSAASKLNMALTGGAGAIIAAILADKSSTAYIMVVDAWEKRTNKSVTLRKFMTDIIRQGLAAKAPDFVFLTTAGAQIANPWNIASQAAIKVEISEEVLIKFWLQLASDNQGHAPIYYAVDGQKGIAFTGDTFQQVTGESKLNVLGLEFKDEPEDMHVVTADGAYVTLNGVYAEESTAITVDGKYITTDVAPE